MRTARSLFLMFVAPMIVLLIYAHWIDPLEPPRATAWVSVFLAVVPGFLGVGTAPWPDKPRAVVAAIYLPLLLISMPLHMLVAACSTGNCL